MTKALCHITDLRESLCFTGPSRRLAAVAQHDVERCGHDRASHRNSGCARPTDNGEHGRRHCERSCGDRQTVQLQDPHATAIL
jgi:hypothetical protein